jgi:hypothetical protein
LRGEFISAIFGDLGDLTINLWHKDNALQWKMRLVVKIPITFQKNTGCPAPIVASFPASGIISNNFMHCTG